jgi:hypothetical protein
MNQKIVLIIAIFTLILVIPTANAQLTLGSEAKQELIEVKINLKGEVNVKHIVRASNVGSTLILFDNAQIPEKQFTGLNEIGEEIQLGIVDDGLGNKSVYVLPSKYNAIIEYNLENIVLTDNLFTIQIAYFENFAIIFDDKIEKIFINDQILSLENKKGINLNGGGEAKIQFYANELKIIKEVIWEENKFDVEIITDSKIEKFNFNQIEKSISLQVNDKNKFITIIMPEKLLGGPYYTLLNDEGIRHSKYLLESNNVLINMKPESIGEITIIGTTVIPEFSMFIPLIMGFLIILTVPFVKKINLH